MLERHRISLPAGAFELLATGAAEAPVVLCLHGFPDHPPSFAPLLGALANAGYRAVAPWLRGYAPSTLEGPFDMDRLADDVLDLCDALSPDRPALLAGHDWGAVLTYHALTRRPERVAAAVAMAVPHPAAFLADALRRPDQLRRSWYMALFQLPWVAERAVRRDDFALIDRLYRDWSPDLLASPQAMRDLKRCLQQSMPAPIAYYQAALRPTAIRRMVQTARPGRIRTPLLYLAGERDGCIASTIGSDQGRLFSGPYRRDVVPGVGHFMQMERPAEIAARILQWFNALLPA